MRRMEARRLKDKKNKAWRDSSKRATQMFLLLGLKDHAANEMVGELCGFSCFCGDMSCPLCCSFRCYDDFRLTADLSMKIDKYTTRCSFPQVFHQDFKHAANLFNKSRSTRWHCKMISSVLSHHPYALSPLCSLRCSTGTTDKLRACS